jgi:hypothetical protein
MRIHIFPGQDKIHWWQKGQEKEWSRWQLEVKLKSPLFKSVYSELVLSFLRVMGYPTQWTTMYVLVGGR